MINVLLVDDHALVRAGLKQLLDTAKGIKVLADAASGEDAIALARKITVDVVVMDGKMPGCGSLEATRRLLLNAPELKILIIAEIVDELMASRFLHAGVMGYITRICEADELINTLRKVHTGQRCVTPDVAQKLALRHGAETSPLECLSSREFQIMEMIIAGQCVQTIAEALHLSAKTVNSHRYRLFAKLHIENDVELTHLAIRCGLLQEFHIATIADLAYDSQHG